MYKEKGNRGKTAVRKNRVTVESRKKTANMKSASLSLIQKMHLSRVGVDKRYLERIKFMTDLD